MIITAHDLHDLRKSGKPYTIIDVRDASEFAEYAPFPEAKHMPMDRLAVMCQELPKNQPVIIVCRHGYRSLQAAGWLNKEGCGCAKSLSGGMAEWFTVYTQV